MGKINIFYSWQSDLPYSTNKTTIEKAIEKAIKELKKKDFPDIDFRLEQDARDETGTPDLANVILKKITQCHIFVCDVSIINPEIFSGGRKTSNPNVLIELGYAARQVSWNQVICVCNTAFGQLEELPFDIRGRGICKYKLSEDGDSSLVREQLAHIIRNRIKGITEALLQVSLSKSAASLLDEIKNDPHGTIKGLTFNSNRPGGYYGTHVLHDFKNVKPKQDDLLKIEEAIEELRKAGILRKYFESKPMTWYLLQESADLHATTRAKTLLEEIRQESNEEHTKGLTLFLQTSIGNTTGGYCPYFYESGKISSSLDELIIAETLAAEKLERENILRFRTREKDSTLETRWYVLRSSDE